jgi:hypothetical protein
MKSVHPRREFPQLRVPGTDSAAVWLTLHTLTDRNFTQRVTIGRRALNQKSPRYHDIVLTRAQLLDLIDEFMDRVDTMTDKIPGAT